MHEWLEDYFWVRVESEGELNHSGTKCRPVLFNMMLKRMGSHLNFRARLNERNLSGKGEVTGSGDTEGGG